MSFLSRRALLRPNAFLSSHAAAPRRFSLASILRSESSSDVHVPPSPYHALFGLEDGHNQYVIDPARLKRSFLEAQKLAHPDVQASQASPGTITSSEVNEAYRTLLSPLKRAEYLLSLRGVNLQETDKLDGEDEDHADFIMEVMEARTELEEASSEEEIREVRAANRERVNEEVQTLEDAFARGDTDTALKATIRLRYWEGLEAAAKEL